MTRCSLNKIFFSILAITTFIGSLAAKQEQTDWLFAVYVAGDNNLHYWLWKNIQQMAKIGSNDRIKVVVQINEPGQHKKTQRYLIEHNHAVLLNKADVEAGKKLDSGSPDTLTDFVVSVVKQFPADHICVILSDHGTGTIDPIVPKTINPRDLFQLNPTDLMLELNRSFSFLDLIEPVFERGICFDDSFHTYLTNQKLEAAFKNIYLQTGRRMDIIGMDACLMQMVEVAKIMRECGTTDIVTDYMIGSQEIELGAGWDYEAILKPFKERSFSPEEFAKHITDCYFSTYSKISKDFTLSVLKLEHLNLLEENINHIADLLIKGLTQSDSAAFRRALLAARARYNVTCFEEPSYVDLGHFYQNLEHALSATRAYSPEQQQLRDELLQALSDGLKLIKEVVIANTTGRNVSRATGISLYFPERRIHSSYFRTTFAASNAWIKFLDLFTKERSRHNHGYAADSGFLYEAYEGYN